MIHNGYTGVDFGLGSNVCGVLQPFLMTNLELHDSHFLLVHFLGSFPFFPRPFGGFFSSFGSFSAFLFCVLPLLRVLSSQPLSLDAAPPAGYPSTGEVPVLRGIAASRLPLASRQP